jgi:hypothetical protein
MYLLEEPKRVKVVKAAWACAGPRDGRGVLQSLTTKPGEKLGSFHSMNPVFCPDTALHAVGMSLLSNERLFRRLHLAIE